MSLGLKPTGAIVVEVFDLLDEERFAFIDCHHEGPIAAFKLHKLKAAVHQLLARDATMSDQVIDKIGSGEIHRKTIRPVGSLRSPDAWGR
ncbi:MAG: hypothetical protein CMJ78_26050 [Planctomycetaceae bacterium]|nr:hypothetical protein [Planctomycetaceae bacterium]